MTLREGRIREKYIVQSTKLPKVIKMRLEALGLTEGTPVTILNNKKSGSVIFCVRGTRLAVGKEIAEAITVTEGVRS